MSEASEKTILTQIGKLSAQVAKSDKANAGRIDELSLLIRGAVDMLSRKAAAIDTIRAEVRAIEGRVRNLEQAKSEDKG